MYKSGGRFIIYVYCVRIKEDIPGIRAKTIHSADGAERSDDLEATACLLSLVLLLRLQWYDWRNAGSSRAQALARQCKSGNLPTPPGQATLVWGIKSDACSGRPREPPGGHRDPQRPVLAHRSGPSSANPVFYKHRQDP